MPRATEAAELRPLALLGGELGEIVAELIQGWSFGGTLRTTATTRSDFGGFAEHANYLSANLCQVDAKIFKDTGCNPFTFSDQAEQ